MMETEDLKVREDITRMPSYLEMAERLEELQKLALEKTDRQDTWERVLKLVISPENNGANKDPELTWLQMFQQVLACELPDAPATFDVQNLAFEDVIVLLSIHIGSLRKEVTSLGKQVANLANRIEKKKSKFQRWRTYQKEKAEKIVEMQENGAYEDHLEAKRPGG